jgi:hypothetical protein
LYWILGGLVENHEENNLSISNQKYQYEPCSGIGSLQGQAPKYSSFIQGAKEVKKF